VSLQLAPFEEKEKNPSPGFPLSVSSLAKNATNRTKRKGEKGCGWCGGSLRGPQLAGGFSERSRAVDGAGGGSILRTAGETVEWRE